MDRQYYLDLAAAGLRMPIGADLVLHEHPEPEAIKVDGSRLGRVVIDAAQRFRTPLALPLMDLMVEKLRLAALLGLSEHQAEQFHLDAATANRALDLIAKGIAPTARSVANLQAITVVAGEKSLLPMGMVIGPFSLMTRLLADPITPVFLAGSGLTAQDEPEVALLEQALRIAELTAAASLREQVAAGAKCVCICEPAASTLFISPKQLGGESDIFERYVIAPHRRLRALLADLDADLMLHDCGTLTDDMLTRLASLDPAILSLGSSRALWDDARLVPASTVLFGNLPTKKFYSDELSESQVARLAADLLDRMRQTRHPFILGSECDVLSVCGAEEQIKRKVDAMMR